MQAAFLHNQMKVGDKDELCKAHKKDAVTVTVIEALGRFIRMIDEEREESNEQDNDI